MDTEVEDNPLEVYKVINDSIHGLIEVPELCVKIIDTPQFQRLRRIKQLGYCYAVYPGASHNRFEHCIGVCYLAGKLAKALRERQKKDFDEWKITNRDILLVQVAGLCHDLGHGPFSHAFDKVLLHGVSENDHVTKHEKRSIGLLKYLRTKNEIPIDDNEIEFIQDLINPGNGQDNFKKYGDKAFLCDIVANKSDGIDVDKWDYFARDCYMLGIHNDFDYNRCIEFSRVVKVKDGTYHICYQDKEAYNLFRMFETRNTLHRRAYQHKTTIVLEQMIGEALVLANKHVKFIGKDLLNGVEQKRTMLEAVTENDMKAYEQITDDVIYQIYYSDSNEEEMKKARNILDRIFKREIYTCVDTAFVGDVSKDVNEKDIQAAIYEEVKKKNNNSHLEENDIVVVIAKFDYGKETQNPIADVVHFYKKDMPDKAYTIHEDQMFHYIPRQWLTKEIRVYCKLQTHNLGDPMNRKLSKENIEKSIDEVKNAFERWRTDNKINEPPASICSKCKGPMSEKPN